MAIELIGKLKPKNNGTFALMDAADVEMPDGTRLSAFQGIVVDSTLDDTSKNPVQNKVITAQFAIWERVLENAILPRLMPIVSETDNGKFLRVVDGAWAAVAVDSAEGASF